MQFFKIEMKIKCLHNYFWDPDDNLKKLLTIGPKSLDQIEVMRRKSFKLSQKC